MSGYLRAAAAIAGAIALAPGLARANDLIYFATSHQGNAVYQVATGGSYSTYATGITATGGGLTFDANKNLYVSSGQNVLVIAPGGGTPSVYSGAIIQPPALNGARPYSASGLAFNAAGALFVGAHEETGGPDPANNYINKIAPGGGSGTSPDRPRWGVGPSPRDPALRGLSRAARPVTGGGFAKDDDLSLFFWGGARVMARNASKKRCAGLAKCSFFRYS